MTNIVYFLPMTQTASHRSSSPTKAASSSTSPVPPPCSARPTRGRGSRSTTCSIVSPDGGAVVTNAGVALQSRQIGGQPDTLLVAGGSLGLKAAMARQDLRRWLRRWRPRPGATARSAPAPSCWRRRVSSTASAWRRTGRAASARRAFSALEVDADSLYVVDGKVWTSAGVTTGIDMALALVEADLGAALANLIARHFVLYARRPGYQSQFSPLLRAQTAAETPFVELIDWMQAHLDQPLDVPALAARAGLSERSFYRKFTEATGKTPAHFVESLRVDAARTLLTQGLPLKAIAGKVGLRSSARLGQAFERRFGMAPSLFREMHGTR